MHGPSPCGSHGLVLEGKRWILFTYFGLYKQMGLEVCIVFKPKKGVLRMRRPNASETYLYVLNISLQRNLESSLKNASLIT